MSDTPPSEDLLKSEARVAHERRVQEAAERKKQRLLEHEQRVADVTAKKAEALALHKANEARAAVQPYKPPKVKKLFHMSMDARIAMCEAQNWHCPDCGKVMDFAAIDIDDRPTLEHVIPLWLGGPDRKRNMVITCHACNQLMGRTMAVMPEADALELAFQRAGMDIPLEAYQWLTREQANDLIRVRSSLRHEGEQSAQLRTKVKNQAEKIVELRRRATVAEREAKRLVER